VPAATAAPSGRRLPQTSLQCRAAAGRHCSAGRPPAEQLSVQPLTTHGFGALVSGLDVRRISAAAAAELQQIFRRHKVLFFHTPGGLAAEELVRFARHFGPPNVYPRKGYEPAGRQGTPHTLPVVQAADTRSIPFGGAGWHTDTSYTPAPPFATLLYAVQTPGSGLGDTLFSDCQRPYDIFLCMRYDSRPLTISRAAGVAAFRSLPHSLQQKLRSLRSLHSSALRGVSGAMTQQRRAAGTPIDATMALEVLQPAVRVHPETGEEALYVDAIHSRSFEGWTEEESGPLLDQLAAVVAKEEFHCRFSCASIQYLLHTATRCRCGVFVFPSQLIPVRM
jgi:taurine dioxygenase